MAMRKAMWTTLALLVMVPAGCDFDGYRLRDLGDVQDGGGDPGVGDSGSTSKPVPSPTKPDATGHCPPETKSCGDVCVSYLDPAFGCGPTCAAACAKPSFGTTFCREGHCAVACDKDVEECARRDCPNKTTFYEDRDNDGWGGANTVEACKAPSGYVEKGGDCNDGNQDVFPRQAKFFNQAYSKSEGGTSFDYDCDGKAQVDPASDIGGTSDCLEGEACDKSSNTRKCWVPRTAQGPNHCGEGRLTCAYPFGWQDVPRVGCH
jgi:hypothetical protein